MPYTVKGETGKRKEGNPVQLEGEKVKGKGRSR